MSDGRQETSEPSDPEVFQIDPAMMMPLRCQNIRNEIAGQYEE